MSNSPQTYSGAGQSASVTISTSSVPGAVANILTGGGPGTATQSLTLDAYLNWRALNLGSSAAIAYILLILVTIVSSVYVGWARRRIARGAL